MVRVRGGGRIARSFATLALGEVATRALTFVVTIRLAHVLGVAGFGALGFASAVLTYLLLVPNLGLDLFGTREVARDRAAARELARAALGLRLLGALVVALLLVPLALLLPVAPDVRAVVLLSGLSLLPYALTVRWLFLGLERPAVIVVATAVGQALVLAGTVAFVRGPADLFRVPPLQAAGELLTALLLLAAVRGEVGWFLPRPRLQTWRAILAQSLPIAAADATRTVVFNFDVVLLGVMLHQVAVGQYVAAYRLILLLLTLGGFYYTALLPALTRSLHRAPGEGITLLRLALRGALLCTAPLAIGGMLLATPLLATLYGAGYQEAAPAFGLLALTVPVVTVAAGFRNVLIASGRQRTDARIVAAGAAINVALNLLLIPTLRLVGAALATVLAESVILLWGWRAVSRASAPLRLGGPILVALGASGLMALALVPLRALPLYLSLPTGGLVYVAGLLLLDRRLARDAWTLAREAPRALRASLSGERSDGRESDSNGREREEAVVAGSEEIGA